MPPLVSGPVRCPTCRSWWRTANSICSPRRVTSAAWRRRRRNSSWSWTPPEHASGRPATCSRTSRCERVAQRKFIHFLLIPLWIIFYFFFFFLVQGTINAQNDLSVRALTGDKNINESGCLKCMRLGKWISHPGRVIKREMSPHAASEATQTPAIVPHLWVLAL